MFIDTMYDFEQNFFFELLNLWSVYCFKFYRVAGTSHHNCMLQEDDVVQEDIQMLAQQLLQTGVVLRVLRWTSRYLRHAKIQNSEWFWSELLKSSKIGHIPKKTRQCYIFEVTWYVSCNASMVLVSTVLFSSANVVTGCNPQDSRTWV